MQNLNYLSSFSDQHFLDGLEACFMDPSWRPSKRPVRLARKKRGKRRQQAQRSK